MKAYIDLAKVLPVGLYDLIIDLRESPTDNNKERASRLNISPQIIQSRFNQLMHIGLVRRIGHGKYINTLDTKINDPLEQMIKNNPIPRRAKRTYTFKSKL